MLRLLKAWIVLMCEWCGIAILQAAHCSMVTCEMRGRLLGASHAVCVSAGEGKIHLCCIRVQVQKSHNILFLSRSQVE